jgi:diguanylate cyclase (GGDEF)-like protein/PAS domain S-box-containing protein
MLHRGFSTARQSRYRVDSLVALGLVGFALLYMTWLIFGWGPPEAQLALADGAYLPLGAFAVVALARASRGCPSRRAAVAWGLVATGFAAYVAGDVAWFVQEVVLGIEPPTPSAADLGWILYYPLVGMGVALLPREDSAGGWRQAIDPALVAVGTGTAVWWLILAPTISSVDDVTTALVAVAYPVGDVALLTIVAAALVGRCRDTSPAALALLATSVAVSGVADLVYAGLLVTDTYESGIWLDAAWVAAWLAAGLAGCIQRVRGGSRGTVLPRPRFGRALPYVAASLLFGVLMAASADQPGAYQLLVAGASATAALVGVRQVITSRENARLEAAAAKMSTEARFAALFRNMHDVIILTDRAGRVTYATPSTEQILGTAPALLRGSHLATVAGTGEAPLVIELLARTAADPGTVGPICVRAGRQGRQWLELLATNLLDDPLVGGMVITVRDATERLTFEEQLRAQALHDPLTGLPNRALLADRLDHALRRARRETRMPALLYLDLDDFKTVNDTMGHGAGDAVLIAVANRLRTCLRVGDTAARLGGDEFAVLLDATEDVHEAITAAERIRAVLLEPVLVAGTTVQVGASVGVVRPVRDQNPEELLRDGDIAMYAAKHAAKGSHRVFEPEMYRDMVDRVQLEADLRTALANGELEVYYQPLFDTECSEVVAVEALLRWHHPARGTVMPDVFIPVAEATGLIRSIGAWVLQAACAAVCRWNAIRGDKPLRASVNVSLRQLDDAFVQVVDGVLARTGLPATLLVLELTETALLADRDNSAAILAALRARGIRISIDDFGTGYSALSYLKDLPVDELKIDRAFVQDLGGAEAQALVETIVALGHSFSLTTVAEGVEEPHQLALLREMGCDVSQGFLLGRPAPAHTLDEVLAPGAASEALRQTA